MFKTVIMMTVAMTTMSAKADSHGDHSGIGGDNYDWSFLRLLQLFQFLHILV